MKNAIVFSAFILNVVFAAESLAQNADKDPIAINDLLGLVSRVDLVVDDQVSDGCWTNSSTVKSKVQLIFEQSNIPVQEYALHLVWQPQVTLFALGGRSGNGMCAVTASLQVYAWSAARLPTFESELLTTVTLASFSDTGIFTNSSNANGQLTDFFEGAASELAANIISARRSAGAKAFRGEFVGDSE